MQRAQMEPVVRLNIRSGRIPARRKTLHRLDPLVDPEIARVDMRQAMLRPHRIPIHLERPPGNLLGLGSQAVQLERKGIHRLYVRLVAIGGLDTRHKSQLALHLTGLEKMELGEFGCHHIGRPAFSDLFRTTSRRVRSRRRIRRQSRR
jgi:hypothetical protein